MNGHTAPELFDSPEDDLRNDPDYQKFSATCEGESDALAQIELADGLRKLRDRQASVDELKAYHSGYLVQMVLNAAGMR